MMRQSVRKVRLTRAHGRPQTAALHHIDVPRSQRAVAELLDAQTPSAAHPQRLLQIRRQIARRRAVDVAGLAIEQPHPSGLQAEKVGHQFQSALQRLLHRRRAVQRFGDGADDFQLASGGARRHGWILALSLWSGAACCRFEGGGTIAAFVLHVIPIRGGNLFQCRRRANRL